MDHSRHHLQDLADNPDCAYVDIQQAEVAALKKLSLGKVAVSDGITAELLKRGSFIIADWLLELSYPL